MTKPNTGKWLACANCKGSYYVRPYRLKRGDSKYCSRRCLFQFHDRKMRIIKNCAICHTAFSVIDFREKTAKYCSRGCYYESLKGRGKEKYTCRCCGKRFFDAKCRKRVFCSKECVGKDSKTRFNLKHPNSMLNAMRRRGLITHCARCGYNAVPAILGIHHKNRRRTDNRLSNIEVLCPNCHSLEHVKHSVVAGKAR